MDWDGLADAFGKAAGGGRGRRKGLLEVLWETLVRWLRPKVRGAVGERVLEGRLRLELAGSGAVVYGPLMVRRGDGAGTTEIDGLVIGRTGIYVIEAKTYKGRVEGRAEDPEWTQVLGRTRRKFLNPLRQNAGHLKDIRRIVGREASGAVRGVVAFSGEAEFAGRRPEGVMDFGDVGKYVKGGGGAGRGLTAEEVAAAKERMDRAIGDVTREEKRRHVERIRERVEKRRGGE